jgi:hypothetical protein
MFINSHKKIIKLTKMTKRKLNMNEHLNKLKEAFPEIELTNEGDFTIGSIMNHNISFTINALEHGNDGFGIARYVDSDDPEYFPLVDTFDEAIELLKIKMAN